MAQMASLEQSVGAGNEERAAGADGQVIGRDAGLEGGVDEDLALGIDFEDGAAAVADKEVALGVEGRAGSHAHALGVNGELAGGVDAIDIALGARGDKEISLGIEGQAGGVQDAGDKRRAAAVGANANHRDRGLLAAGAGDGGVDHAGAADGRAGDRMQAVGKLAGHAQGHGVGDAGGVARPQPGRWRRPRERGRPGEWGGSSAPEPVGHRPEP